MGEKDFDRGMREDLGLGGEGFEAEGVGVGGEEGGEEGGEALLLFGSEGPEDLDVLGGFGGEKRVNACKKGENGFFSEFINGAHTNI